MSENSKKMVKKRNWAFVLYPESAPIDWKEQLQQTGLPIVISPLHDRDIDPTGEPKKSHYHIILCYAGPTSYNVVSKLTDQLNQPIPQPLEQVRGYYRYLTHKDNPEKIQYEESDIVTLNGFNILDFTEITRAELQDIKIKIQIYIRENDIFEYADLMDKLLDDGMMTEHEVAANHTVFCNTYIKSRRYKRLGQSVRINKATGEILK